jgi:predicted DNA binding CopG/RHH family protein
MKEQDLKPFRTFRSDEEAEQFVESADLSGYDFSGFRPTRFEFDRKTAQLNMRLPEALLDAVKARALARGIPYTRYIRELIERDVTAPG